MAGFVAGQLLGGVSLVMISFPLSMVVAALAGCLSEGTGLILTPAGLLQLVEYTKQRKKSSSPWTKVINSFCGIDNEAIDMIKKLLYIIILVTSLIYILSNEIDSSFTIPNSIKNFRFNNQ